MSQLLVSTAQLIDRGVGSFCRVVLITTGLFMLAVLTIIVMQRYTNIGTFDSGSELCSLAFPIFVMAGIVDAARKGAHVATQILLNALGATGRIFLVIVLHGITAIAYFYLAWYAYQNALIAHDELSTVLQVPGSLGYGSLTVGLVLVGLCSMGAIVRHTLGREPVHVNLADAGPGRMSLIMVVVFAFLLAISYPVAHALVVGSTLGILSGDRIPMFAVIQQLMAPSQSFPLIAIPFFVMSGELMMSGKLGKHLIDFATDLVGRFRGGHAQVSVLGSTLFGGVSGSAVADATALGAILVPWQKKLGYPGAFCGATIAAASTIDILVSNASIGGLFYAGIVPGLLLAVGFLAVCNISARLRGFPYEKNPVNWVQMAKRGFYALPALMLPVFVLVGLRFGFATPTEISTFAVVYSIVVSGVIYRDMTWERIANSLVFAGAASGVVLLLIMGSSCAGWIMTLEQIPERFIEWAQGSFNTQAGILALMNLLMLVAGMFIDLPAAILLLGPLFVPLANAYHIDLIQLGVMMVVNLAIGLYSPPVGTTLFIGSMLAKASIGQTVKELLPFYAVGLIVLGMMTYIPAMTLRF